MPYLGAAQLLSLRGLVFRFLSVAVG